MKTSCERDEDKVRRAPEPERTRKYARISGWRNAVIGPRSSFTPASKGASAQLLTWTGRSRPSRMRSASTKRCQQSLARGGAIEVDGWYRLPRRREGLVQRFPR